MSIPEHPATDICNGTDAYRLLMDDGYANARGFSWLHDVETLVCGCGEWDNDRTTLLSRIFLPVFYLVALVAGLFLSYKESADLRAEKQRQWNVQNGYDSDESWESLTDEENDMDAKDVVRPKPERRWDFDYARIVCIAATVTEHSGGDHFSKQNIVWVQQWVLPYLYGVSGFAYMFASGPLWQYELKLLIVFLIGTGANWIADLISGRDWKGSQFANTIFQMAYVLVLMLLGALLAPLKDLIIWRSSNPDKQFSKMPGWACKLVYVVGMSLFALICLCLSVSNVNLFTVDKDDPLAGSGAGGFLSDAPFLLVMQFGTMAIACLCLVAGYSGWLPWILLAVLYVTRTVIPYDRAGHPLNADIYVLGMVCHSIPFKGQRQLATVMREYWPFFFMFMLSMSMPETYGRCDLHPHNKVWERFRFYLVESLLLLFLMSGAMNTADTYQVTGSMNMWALYAYVFHVAWDRIIPAPYGALFTYSAIPVFCLIGGCARRKSMRDKPVE